MMVSIYCLMYLNIFISCQSISNNIHFYSQQNWFNLPFQIEDIQCSLC